MSELSGNMMSSYTNKVRICNGSSKRSASHSDLFSPTALTQLVRGWTWIRTGWTKNTKYETKLGSMLTQAHQDKMEAQVDLNLWT